MRYNNEVHFFFTFYITQQIFWFNSFEWNFVFSEPCVHVDFFFTFVVITYKQYELPQP